MFNVGAMELNGLGRMYYIQFVIDFKCKTFKNSKNTT